MNLTDVIISEMGRGNFSFLILVVGIAQLIVMIWKKIKRGGEPPLFFYVLK